MNRLAARVLREGVITISPDILVGNLEWRGSVGAGRRSSNMVPGKSSTLYSPEGRFAAMDFIDGGQFHHALPSGIFPENFTMTYNRLTGIAELTTWAVVSAWIAFQL